MNDAQFLSVAWNQLIQVSLLTVGVWLLTKLFARNRPHLAHAMWLVVLAKCVTPPLLESPTALFGHLSVPEPVWFEPEEIVVEEAIEPVVPEPRVVASSPEFESEITVDPLSQGYVLEDDALLGQLMFEDAAFELEDEPVEAAAAISKPPVAEPSVTFLPLWKLWLISAGTVMSLIFLRVMCTLWRVKRHRTEAPPELLELVQRLSKQFKLRRRVRVLITSSRVGPAVVGLFRPLLILPDVVTNGRSAKELEPIVAHELLHVRRGDLGIGWLQMLVQSLWWFHPLIWLVNRLLNRETERCCDEAVLAELNCSPGTYARCLLNVLEQKRNLTPIPAFPGVKPVELTKQRMERIMKLGQGCRKRSPWWCWLVVFLLGAVVLPGTAQSQNEDLKPETQSIETRTSNAEPANAEQVLTPRVYDVRELLETLRDEYQFEPNEAERALEQLVGISLSQLKVAVNPLMPEAKHDPRQCLCSGVSLFAVNTPQGHRQIKKLLELWKENGLYQVTIEGCMATVPVGFLATNLPSNQRVPLQQTESDKITTPALPSLTLSNHEFKELQELIQSDTRSNLIAFPKSTVTHGTKAVVMDVVEYPFIMDFKGEQAQIEFLKVGLELDLTPFVRDKNVTQLEFKLRFSQLAKHESKPLRWNLSGRRIESPTPVFDVARMNVSVMLERDKTLMLRGLQKGSGKDAEEFVVFLTATVAKMNRDFLEPVSDVRFGAGVNSEAGVAGSTVLDKRHFDLQSQEHSPNSNDETGRIESQRAPNPDAHAEVLLDDALRSYATQLKRELLIDEAALGALKIPIDHRVKVYSLKTHTPEMALKETLRPLELTYALHDRKVPNQAGTQPMLLVFEQRLLDNHDGPLPYDRLVEMMLERNKQILRHAGDRVANEQARLMRRIPHDIHAPTLKAGLELFEKVADVSIEIEPEVLKAAEDRFLQARTKDQRSTWEIRDREFLSALRHSLAPLDLVPVVTHRGPRHTPQIVVRIVPKDPAESDQASRDAIDENEAIAKLLPKIKLATGVNRDTGESSPGVYELRFSVGEGLRRPPSGMSPAQSEPARPWTKQTWAWLKHTPPWKKYDREISVSFDQIPLRQAIEQICAAGELKFLSLEKDKDPLDQILKTGYPDVMCEESELRELGEETTVLETPVTFSAENKAAMPILEEILEPFGLGLGHMNEVNGKPGGCFEIRTKAFLDRTRWTLIYPVGDLLEKDQSLHAGPTQGVPVLDKTPHQEKLLKAKVLIDALAKALTWDHSEANMATGTMKYRESSEALVIQCDRAQHDLVEKLLRERRKLCGIKVEPATPNVDRGPGVMPFLSPNPIAVAQVDTVQIRFQKPEKSRLRIDRTVDGKRISTQYELPVRHNFRAGGQRFRLTFDNIAGRVVKSDWPVPYQASRSYSWTLELPEMTERSRKYLAHNSVPVALTDEDLDQIDAGNLVTKVVYLPHPERQELAIANLETIVSTRLDPSKDAVEEAKKRGTIVAVMRSLKQNTAAEPWSGVLPPFWAKPIPTPKTLEWHDGAWKLRGDELAEERKADQPEPGKVIAKVYPVADLVVPIPGTESDPVKDDPILSKLPNQSKLFKTKKKPLSVSAQPLIDLIRKSIEPESWTGEEAVGTIAFHEEKLSLVIRHKESVHLKVSELITTLRSKQDLQVTLECLTVQFEKNSFSDFWTKVGIVIDHADASAKNSMKPLIFHGVKRDDFRSKIDQFEAAQVLSFPKVTVFNGVGAQIQISGAGADKESVPKMHYMIVPTISEDRRTIDVKFAVNAANTLDALTKAKSMTIPDGTSVLIEVTDELLSGQKRTGVPEVDKALRELKKKELGLRTFVLLTARIIIQEEEEEVLNTPLIIEEEEEPLSGIPQSEAPQPAPDSNTRVGTVTPRIIVQEEEEALLGLPQPTAEPKDRTPAPAAVPANPSP